MLRGDVGYEASLLMVLILFLPSCLLDLQFFGYVGLVAGDDGFIFINVWDVEDFLTMIITDCVVGGAELSGHCFCYGREGNSSLIW